MDSYYFIALFSSEPIAGTKIVVNDILGKYSNCNIKSQCSSCCLCAHECRCVVVDFTQHYLQD